MNKKIILAVCAFVVIIFCFFAFQGRPNNEGVIKIGIVAPLTGPASTYGTGLSKGAIMAQEDLIGRKYKYELIIEDDASNPAQSASAVSKLINIDKVQAVISTTAGTGNAIKSIAANSRIPHISVSADVTIADNQYNFVNSVLPDEEAATWLHEASSLGVKTIAIISQNHAGFNLLTDNVKAKAKDSGIDIVYNDRFEPTVKDFNTSIAKAKLTKPDLYLIGAFIYFIV